LLTPLPWGTGRTKKETYRKAKRLMDQYNASLGRKVKAACTSKAKRGIHSPLPISRQRSSPVLGSRASTCL